TGRLLCWTAPDKGRFRFPALIARAQCARFSVSLSGNGLQSCVISVRALRGGYIMSTASSEFAHIGKSVRIKGDLSGSEDLYIDGQVDGTIQLSGNSLTIGPNGRVHANVSAKNVIVGGTIEGNIQAGERTELRKTAVVNGDVQSKRIAIEEGAFFNGKLEIVPEGKSQSSPPSIAAAASTGARSSSASETSR